MKEYLKDQAMKFFSDKVERIFGIIFWTFVGLFILVQGARYFSPEFNSLLIQNF